MHSPHLIHPPKPNAPPLRLPFLALLDHLSSPHQILPETYQAMPSYRLCTADGLLSLTPGLAQKLAEVLKERALAEQRAAQAPQ